MVPTESADLLTSLLERQPEQRLGSSTVRGKNEVCAHPYFAGLHWDSLLKRTAQPPYIPQIGPPPRLDSFKRDTKRASEPEASKSASKMLGGFNSMPVQSFGSPEQCNLDAEDEESLPPDDGADLSCFEGF